MKPLAENVEIRPMTAADVTRVMEIAASLPEAPQWPEAAYLTALNPESSPRRIALVAAGPGPGVQGFTVASLLPSQAELESIAVAAGSQQRGLGRMLFEAPLPSADFSLADSPETAIYVNVLIKTAAGIA
jgi:ribosomal protein S18 acetylase RimI-like enzyme